MICADTEEWKIVHLIELCGLIINGRIVLVIAEYFTATKNSQKRWDFFINSDTTRQIPSLVFISYMVPVLPQNKFISYMVHVLPPL